MKPQQVKSSMFLPAICLFVAMLTGWAMAKPTLPTYANRLGMKFVLIPAGSFMMGSPVDEPGREPGEGPQHKVSISRSFYLQTTEVTQDQWRAVMGDNPARRTGKGSQPVEHVSWQQAQEFIRRLNKKADTRKYSLPTEVEWEYACRAGTVTPYAFGPTTTPAQAAYHDKSKSGSSLPCTTEAASHPPNKWGLYDMHGNVWEWCSDWYAADYYAGSPAKNPKGPAKGTKRVCRGGSIHDGPQHLRSAARGSGDPAFRRYITGLRLARDR